MKKLSTEEKAKAYDEALKRAIKHRNNDGLTLEQYETIDIIFPELKESEDERIKKEIIQFLQLPHPQFVGKRKQEDWIAWLEKQDEKIEPIEGFNTEFERQISHLIASAINREHEYNEGYVKWTANALLNFAKHELEKQGEKKSIDDLTPQEAMDIAVAKCFEQGEQKSAWSEEDMAMLDSTIAFVEHSPFTTIGKGKNNVIAWLKNLKDKVLTQRK